MSKIAIIDDAIHDTILKRPVSSRFCLKDGTFHEMGPSICDELTHGTLVAKVLENYATDYQLISIQILENWFKQRAASPALLEAALRFCLQIGVDMINVSVGSERLSDFCKIKALLAEFKRLNIPIVAACSNAGVRTIPASCESVFGVVCDDSGTIPAGEYVVKVNPYLGSQFIANYELKIPEERRFPQSNSLAAPVIAAHVNNLLNCNMERSLPDVLGQLKEFSKHSITVPDSVGRKFQNPSNIPVVGVMDIFVGDMKKQISVLDEFALHGYEAVGISNATDGSDVRLWELSNTEENPLSCVLDNIASYTKADLIILFLDNRMASCILTKDERFDICIGLEKTIEFNPGDKLFNTIVPIKNTAGSADFYALLDAIL